MGQAQQMILISAMPYLLLIGLVVIGYFFITGKVQKILDIPRNIVDSVANGYEDLKDTLHNSAIARKLRGELTTKEAIERAQKFREKIGASPEDTPGIIREKVITYLGTSRH